jgi:hypothetical protein
MKSSNFILSGFNIEEKSFFDFNLKENCIFVYTIDQLKKIIQESDTDYYNSCKKSINEGRMLVFGTCHSDSDSVISRGLVDGGWIDLINNIDPKQQIDHDICVIRDCGESYCD